MPMARMRALLSRFAGGPDSLSLGEVEIPVPGPGEVRIAVKACGINFPDTLVIEDRYQFKPDRPFAPGGEVAGIVDAVGPGVTRFRKGDRVIGSGINGGLAEYTVLEEFRCFILPEPLPLEEGAGLLMTYGTSHHALKDRAKLAAGEKLLVLGAAGGVGLAAVELGKARGAFVIGAVSSEEKAQVVRDKGADAVIVYPRDLDKDGARAFTDRIRAEAGGPIDVVYDPVGGPYAEPSLRALGWDGRHLVVGFPAGIPRIPLNLPLLKSCSIVGVFWGAFIENFPESNRANVEELIEYWRQGLVRPLISARFPLERGGEAIAQLGSRAAIGKIVVLVDAPDTGVPA